MVNDSQYEEIGAEFIDGQRKYFSTKTDHAREFIRLRLPDLSGKAVLDVGCGHGSDILTYEKLGAREVYGIDISSFMIEEAKKVVKSPDNLFVGSMDSIPLGDRSIDVIVGRFSLHYLSELDKAYEEFARILNDDGSLIAVAHHPLKSFVQTGSRDYTNKDNVEMQLYDNKVTIRFPHHTLKEFFSDAFFGLFYLDYLDEESSIDPEYPNEQNLPGYLAFKAIKR